MARTLVPLAQGCEELEAITVIDLLRRAGVEVVSAGLDSQSVRASRGVVLVPDTTLEQVMNEPFDMIVLPGGLPGADNLNQDPRIHTLLQTMYRNGKHVAAICAAPKVLASAGLLRGRKATGYPGVLEKTGQTEIDIASSAVVRDGTVITSRGAGTAMDFALELIEVLAGSARRQEVEKALVR